MYQSSQNAAPRALQQGQLAARALLLLGLAVAMLWLASGAAQAQTSNVHVVQPGETLSQIAKQHGTTTAALMRINGLASADLVRSGAPLRLPADADAEIAPADAAAPISLADLEAPTPDRFVDADGAFPYIVEPGDTLASIAAEFRVGVSVLIDLNRLAPAQRLTPGQQLLVPYSPFGGGRDRLHIVQPGESLGGLASRYGTTVNALVARNNIANPNVVAPGTQLLVPPPPPVERMTVFPIDSQGKQRPLIFPTMEEKWIQVDLSEQRVVAYEGTEPVNSFVISSGKAGTPTVTGTFRIWIKTPMQDMWGGNRAAGDYYYLPGVKWVQYFHKDYSFHTAYWHNGFGRPMSRGCINMREADAKWLFEWAGPYWDEEGDWWQEPTEENPGALVVVHQ